MCDICLQFPCLTRCPNYEPRVIHKCHNCGEDICEGNYFYRIDGDPWCTDCIEDCREVAEEE